MTTTVYDLRIITDFIQTAKADRAFPRFHLIKVRGRALAERLGVRELRTRKNTYMAVAHDELGNTTILDKRGNVRQLIGSEYTAF